MVRPETLHIVAAVTSSGLLDSILYLHDMTEDYSLALVIRQSINRFVYLS